MAGALAKLSRIRAALEAAKSLDDVVNIRDQATAMATYAKAVGLSIENVNSAIDIKLSAERKAGELLAAMVKSKGVRLAGRRRLRDATAETLSDLGISKIQSHRWQKLAAIPVKVYCKFRDSVSEAGEELTTAAVMRHWSQLSKPTNGNAAKRPPNQIDILESLHLAMKAIYKQCPQEHRKLLATKLRLYADELDATGGLEL